jgi:hypothetical protein
VTITISDIYVVSDGDAESDGDLRFILRSCPSLFWEDIVGNSFEEVQWAEGRHSVNREFTSQEPSAPDQFRLLIIGVDDDRGGTGSGQSTPHLYCETGGNLEPRKGGRGEWNAVIMDLDLSKYPGAKATEQFVKRAQPLGDGSTLMFEVRGYVTVTRE